MSYPNRPKISIRKQSQNNTYTRFEYKIYSKNKSRTINGDTQGIGRGLLCVKKEVRKLSREKTGFNKAKEATVSAVIYYKNIWKNMAIV